MHITGDWNSQRLFEPMIRSMNDNTFGLFKQKETTSRGIFKGNVCFYSTIKQRFHLFNITLNVSWVVVIISFILYVEMCSLCVSM